MDRFIDILSALAFVVAAINLVLAMFYHRRYTLGPSSTKNFGRAQFHWIASAFYVIVAALADRSLPLIAAVVIVVAAPTACAVPIAYLRRIRRERIPTFLDQIWTDDIIARADNDGREH
ncbi:hypothetical protein HQ346_24850 [Rhodococcus sp. BP-252]|uniref:hypothetical protein n=1 Tax=unclassified Rhodococcus (in: high G+C Gram-positive bacteria) TaxID=192944 RepID=UPI001C9B16E6|nr:MULTISPECIES: hypothetical protein [unclassified Rhodococcus (in: high G+C Gram-positive bacteria)]MBY6414815.1 hypothetical protein [Rhodococcus sp. BP-320]MBY6419718.1 hypothetical protein [Rhodococcus sp. BP-321]MBY6424713.1 hypothetical protein [Rhodococcus sp. BP-324]MBY6429693.1 hypothetical protein [Rhodococcus sp. BP-323]MBY6434665.1 hypothetical protein [Rhodococcus sp. BP-322]